ncbi:membrane protease YdiL (CAAX protease family) [Mycolicibacterium mucogenicum 261Sha1.1M5]|nr:membrane protease YdiL (CAAX protease family) [Mycolicibacterium mucogenicum 261Sha1.1M5]
MKQPVPGEDKTLSAARRTLFLVLYIVLTVWIFIGRELVPEAVFTGVKNSGYVIVMLLGSWVFRASFARSWRTTKQRPVLALGMVAVGLTLMGVASAISQAALLVAGYSTAGGNQAAISAEVLNASTSFVGALLFVGLGGVVAPIVEELVFRELPLGQRRRAMTTWIAVTVSCLVFAAIHVRGWDEWPLMILYAGYAAALSAAYLLSGRNLLVSILAHVLWNGIGLVFLIASA